LLPAALQALRTEPKGVGGKVIIMLIQFFTSFPSQRHPAAMAVLVPGDAVELTVRYMVETGPDMHPSVVDLMLDFMDDTRGKERMCVPGLVNQLVKGFAKWLPKVRIIALWSDVRNWEQIPEGEFAS
jgi:hypothetical protein